MRRIAVGAIVALGLLTGTATADAQDVRVTGDADPSVVVPVLPSGSSATLNVNATRAAHLRFVVPSAATPVLRGELRLEIRDPSAQALELRVARATWDERTLTWLDAPRPGGDALRTIRPGAAGTVHVDLGVALAAPGSYDVVISGGLVDPAKIAARESGAGAVLTLSRATAAQDRLATRMADLAGAEHVTYDLHASDGSRMDALDVVTAGDGPGAYLGVAHREVDGRFVTALFSSPDLRSWTRVRDLVDRASQPALAALPGGAWLLAVEIDEPEPDGVRRGHLRFLRYPSLDALRGGDPDWRFDAPRTQSTVDGAFEGTPSLGAVTATTADVGFHHLDSEFVDRNDRGVLSGIGTATPGWTTRRATAVDAPLLRQGLAGNLGDRDELTLDGAALTVVEGQRVARDFATWSVYVLDGAGTDAQRVTFRTPGGSTSFGNPTASVVPLPDGGSGLVVTAFAFSEGAASGEAGELLAVYRLPA